MPTTETEYFQALQKAREQLKTPEVPKALGKVVELIRTGDTFDTAVAIGVLERLQTITAETHRLNLKSMERQQRLLCQILDQDREIHELALELGEALGITPENNPELRRICEKEESKHNRFYAAAIADLDPDNAAG